MSASLQRRLWLAAALPLLALVLAGLLLLQWAFEDTVRRAFDARLERTLTAVVGGLEATPDGRVAVGRPIGQAAFDSIGSGWYWQVADDTGVRLRSRSLWDRQLPMPSARRDGRVRHTDLASDGATPLRAAVRRIELHGRPAPVTVLLAGPRAEIDAEVADFVRLSWLAAVGLAVLALAMVFVQLRLGLAPLRRFSEQVAELAAGRREALDRLAVRELDAVVAELNPVIEQNRRLAENGRKRAGDLAHALKTPLALLRTRVPTDDTRQREALARIEAIVDGHLARAAAGARRNKPRCDAAAALGELVALLGRLHPGKAIAVAPHATVPEAACEANDLQEMLGNLIDNALRAARLQVRVSLSAQGDDLHILVDDDGRGLDEQALARLGERGLRFDESTPGTGLGVSISRDIAESYDGHLDFGRSPLGGLQARLRLPAWRDR
ncbi:sensor histidine kinase [Silanimonas algicola]